jgi:hypothetical protein
VALQTIVDNVQTIVASLSGIRSAPDDPIESPNAFPFGATFPGSGTWDGGSVGKILTRASHDISVIIVVARKDLPRDIQKSIGYADLFQAAIQADPTLSGAVDVVDLLNYTFGPIAWGGTECRGYTFSLTVLDSNC